MHVACRSGVAQYQNGSVYIGDFKKDHRWGWGTQYFANKEQYEGEWEDDKMTGGCLAVGLVTGCAAALGLRIALLRIGAWKQGIFQFPSSLPVGCVPVDALHLVIIQAGAVDTCIAAPGHVRKRHWPPSMLLHERSPLQSSVLDNTVRVATVSGLCSAGKGRYTLQDGSYFEGDWKDGQRVKGKAVSADGSFEYSGGWKGELRHGYGIMYQASAWLLVCCW